MWSNQAMQLPYIVNDLWFSVPDDFSFFPWQDKAKQLFPKDTEITHAVVLKKLHEILSARGKKVTSTVIIMNPDKFLLWIKKLSILKFWLVVIIVIQ